MRGLITFRRGMNGPEAVVNEGGDLRVVPLAVEDISRMESSLAQVALEYRFAIGVTPPPDADA